MHKWLCEKYCLPLSLNQLNADSVSIRGISASVTLRTYLGQGVFSRLRLWPTKICTAISSVLQALLELCHLLLIKRGRLCLLPLNWVGLYIVSTNGIQRKQCYMIQDWGRKCPVFLPRALFALETQLSCNEEAQAACREASWRGPEALVHSSGWAPAC